MKDCNITEYGHNEDNYKFYAKANKDSVEKIVIDSRDLLVNCIWCSQFEECKKVRIIEHLLDKNLSDNK